MKVIFNYRLSSFFIAATIIVNSSLIASAQRFETNKVYLSEDGSLTTNTPVDTLKVIQSGKDSTTISEVTSPSTSSPKNVSSTNKSSSLGSAGGQCTATTKKGTRCSRKASAGSIYCWQHNKSISDVTSTSTSSPNSVSYTNQFSSTSLRSTGGQCAARTKKGTRCSRKAAAGSKYCWQHNK